MNTSIKCLTCEQQLGCLIFFFFSPCVFVMAQSTKKKQTRYKLLRAASKWDLICDFYAFSAFWWMNFRDRGNTCMCFLSLAPAKANWIGHSLTLCSPSNQAHCVFLMNYHFHSEPWLDPRGTLCPNLTFTNCTTCIFFFKYMWLFCLNRFGKLSAFHLVLPSNVI